MALLDIWTGDDSATGYLRVNKQIGCWEGRPRPYCDDGGSELGLDYGD
jgi:hypothetical protein